MKGYAGRFLRVDLSKGAVIEEPLPLQVAMDFIAGRGFGIKYLYDELLPHIDPLGEQNKILIAPGILAGSAAQSCSRWVVCTKSPLTGCYARASSGGDFGAWMKFAGYDFILIQGISSTPVYLHVTKEKAELKKADELWGTDTAATQEWLERQHGPATRTACIGPAAEKLVKYAAIVTGRRTASRCGVGTVMGSKRLKAIAITAKRNLDFHDPEAFRALAKEQLSIMKASRDYGYNKSFGTTEGAITRNVLGVYPTRNYRSGQLDGFEQMGPEAYRNLRVADVGCYNCGMRCGKVHVVTDGPYAGARSEGPEYESYWAFSGSIESTSVEATIAADQLCDDLGMDTISAGVTIGFAYELYERGIITKADTDGLDLTYGNHAAMVELIGKIGRREGFGNILAEGSVGAARLIGKGAEAYAMHAKGLELAGYEPRGLKATGFGYATSNIGGSHGNGSLAFQEWGMPVPRAVDRFTEEDKADIVIHNQNGSALEVGIVCAFAFSCGDWFGRLFPRMLAAATGIEEFADWKYLRKAGERILNLDRAFNARDGFDRRHDTLPKRFQTEPLHTGSAPGEGEMVRSLDRFLDEYYRLRNWTRNGLPTREKLEELGLGRIAKDLAPFWENPGT
ncbi:MAG TPA: aldehyde ferredoxin oxidoreductase family protein [Syntrophorhabdales bacterium]|nr:aldehyde ferredoxin oxidoreductase family protein [Syntrophorhabdales bacterium]